MFVIVICSHRARALLRGISSTACRGVEGFATSGWYHLGPSSRGASVPPLDPQFDAKRFRDELGSALKLEVLRADSISTVEHYSLRL
jgi:hypothetical protein